MADESLVQPIDPNAAAPAPQAPQEQPQAGSGVIPEELLHYPFMQAVIAGSPPAVSDRIKDFSHKEYAKALYENKDALQEAGLGFYRSLSGQFGVIFNALHLHPEDIQAADKAGKLLQIAPDLDTVDREIAKSGANNPIFKVSKVPGGFAPSVSASIPPQAGAQAASGSASAAAPSQAPAIIAANAGAPPSEQRKLLQARLTNMNPGAPTAGPSPGSGRLLNSILKPVV